MIPAGRYAAPAVLFCRVGGLLICWASPESGRFEHMPIPDREKLRAELEVSGEKEVRGKLAAGLYGAWKVETIKEWLRDQEESQGSVAAEEARTHVKQNLTWSKIGVIAAVVGAVAAVIAIWF